MSLPTFPSISPPLTMNESLNMILASIAMEELGLSHIINAESEKLQYVLCKLDGCPCEKASIQEVLAVNKSIKNLLDSIMENQVILKSKMECALDALGCECSGPTGATGPKGDPGLPGPAGPAGRPGGCCATAFPGCPGQHWAAGASLIWSQPGCPERGAPRLSQDGGRIILPAHRSYVVSFSIGLSGLNSADGGISIRVQSQQCGKQSARFDCNVPVANPGAPVTASAGGVFISTHGCPHPAELTLTLLSPASAQVDQASICVMEI